MENSAKIKNIAVLGSTGSIGTQTLDIIERHPQLYRATVLSAGRQVDKLIEQCKRVHPDVAIIADHKAYSTLAEALQPLGITCMCGEDSMCEAVSADNVDMVLTATVGYSGLAPTVAAIESGKDIALANKETLVVAGEYITGLLKDSSTRIYPVDSEHSAIYQCLVGEDHEMVDSLLITASGGPFRTWEKERIAKATASDALKHPNWSMGAKITIDSATMMNKAFELIEARWLFDIAPERIHAVVHPQSIIHSMVQFKDGAIKAQLGVPDMHLPIAYALGCAERMQNAERPLSLKDMALLTLEKPDTERFPCLTLADTAMARGGNTACVINAANEIAVDLFLKGKLSFYNIYELIMRTLQEVSFISTPDYQDYVNTNAEARRVALTIAESGKIS
ncbi:MAG: 1-deoxy-D-xylulose-5-phosphate reductoisomerase [Muribaculaceae bacterium]|nr:1-deoxy-D-xylulose-5-phosphate reductoisomerase [Muribaculaceae bacterium]